MEHLFYLTSGLKSQIIGEDQILTQVKDALNLARENFAADGVLEVLFRMAVTAGKRIKTEVPFSHGNPSVIHQAIGFLADNGYSLKDKICMVIGNGEMGKVAAQALREAGADVTGLISSEKAVLMENRQTDPEEFLKKIDGVDLILTEGFKQGPWPKIMLHRKGTGKPMPLLPEECLAVISDVEIPDCENVFPLEEIAKTADFLFRYIQNIS